MVAIPILQSILKKSTYPLVDHHIAACSIGTNYIDSIRVPFSIASHINMDVSENSGTP